MIMPGRIRTLVTAKLERIWRALFTLALILLVIALPVVPASATTETSLGMGTTAGGPTLSFKLPQGLRFTDVISTDDGPFGIGDDGTLYTMKSEIAPVKGSLADKRVRTVVADNGNYFAIDDQGTLHAWGTNSEGQLADGTRMSRTVPDIVATLPASTMTASVILDGYGGVYAVSSEGTLFAWGRNSYGRLGIGTSDDQYLPARVKGIPSDAKIADVLVYATRTYAIDTSGSVYGWGSNGTLLGDGFPLEKDHAVHVFDLPDGTGQLQYAARNGNTFILARNGELFTWGDNSNGELGIGSSTASSTPTKVTFPTADPIVDIHVQDHHAFARDTKGRVYGWGYNLDGRLGDGTTVTRLAPTLITGIDAPVAMLATTAWYSHYMFALGENGAVYAWGDNSYGQLGDGTTTSRVAPVVLQGLPDDLLSIDGGVRGGYALSGSGELYSWGNGDQLGRACQMVCVRGAGSPYERKHTDGYR